MTPGSRVCQQSPRLPAAHDRSGGSPPRFWLPWSEIPFGSGTAALSRPLLAWCPKQHASGGKNMLPGIPKRGDTSLCTLLIHLKRMRCILRRVPLSGKPTESGNEDDRNDLTKGNERRIGKTRTKGTAYRLPPRKAWRGDPRRPRRVDRPDRHSQPLICPKAFDADQWKRREWANVSSGSGNPGDFQQEAGYVNAATSLPREITLLQPEEGA